MKIVFIRQEDYWLFPLSFIGVVFSGAFFYAGARTLQLTTGLIGFSVLYFGTYIIRKNYSKKLSAVYLLICLVSSALLGLAAHALTN